MLCVTYYGIRLFAGMPHNIAGYVHPFGCGRRGATSCVTGFVVTLTKENLYLNDTLPLALAFLAPSAAV